MKLTPREYARRVKRVSPRSPLGSDCLWAFFVGGGICLLGEVLRGWYLGMGLEAQLAGTLTSCTLVALGPVYHPGALPEACCQGRGRLAGAHHGLCQRGGQRGH